MHLVGYDLLNRPVIYSCFEMITNRVIEDNRCHMISMFEQVYSRMLRCRALHCIALHCIALHCIALHCNANVLSVPAFLLMSIQQVA